MQLINFKLDRAAQAVSSPASSKMTHTLTYRGVSYELPKHHSSHPIRTVTEIAQLMGKPLIYRGRHYEIAFATVSINSIVQKSQRLIYRGATYVINAA
jgi:acetylglutamate kinase